MPMALRAFLLCGALLYLRASDRFAQPEIWAEDAKLLSNVFEHCWGALWVPLDGYFHFVSVTALKFIPVYLTLNRREPFHDSVVLPLKTAFHVFLNPFQTLHLPVTEGLPFMFHEFGCYLGWLPLLLLLKLILTKYLRKENMWFLLFFLLWFWVGTGWGTPFNPWLLYQKIPILNQSHVQTRLFIVMYVFFIVLVTRSLDTLKSKKPLWAIVALLLLLEAFFVRFHILNSVGIEANALPRDGLMTSTTLEETITEGWVMGHLLTPNKGDRIWQDVLEFSRAFSFT